MNRRAGTLLMLTGIGHAFVGLVLFHEALAAILRDGFLNAVFPHLDREATFWFLLFSPLCFLLGQVFNRAVERGDSRLLTLLGWHILALGVVGVVAMPISGFWILIAIAPLILRATRDVDHPTAPPATGSLESV